MRLYLYGHGDCSLCNRLERMVLPLLVGHDASLTKRDITTHPHWQAMYRDRIPVLTDEQGRVIVEGRPDAADVESALRPLLKETGL